MGNLYWGILSLGFGIVILSNGLVSSQHQMGPLIDAVLYVGFARLSAHCFHRYVKELKD